LANDSGEFVGNRIRIILDPLHAWVEHLGNPGGEIACGELLQHLCGCLDSAGDLLGLDALSFGIGCELVEVHGNGKIDVDQDCLHDLGNGAAQFCCIGLGLPAIGPRLEAEGATALDVVLGHEIADELPVAPDAVPTVSERPGAAEAGEVRHDEAHFGELVRNPEQAVVVAAEAVDDQDGAGFRHHPDRFVGPKGDCAAIEPDVRCRGPCRQLRAEV